MTEKEFDFVTQIKAGNLYELLIPDKEKGLLIFKIYEQIKYRDSEIFTEEDLKKIISNYKNYPRNEQHEDIKDIIRDLNEFFLKSTGKGYRLTEYAKSFSESIRKKLLEDFKPSEVVIRLTQLKKSFQESDFNDWVEYSFNEQKVHIERQLEGLERQVINTIKQFRKDIIEENIDALDFVKNVLKNLEVISSQTQKLKDAFRYADDINRDIDNIDFEIELEPEKALANQQSIKDFFETISLDLERISKRIERIQPKLRQFYGNMTRIDFERNTKKFLEYLLENTSTIGYKPYWKLKFPNVPNTTLELENEKFSLSNKFLYVDSTIDLYRKTRMKFYKPDIDKSKLEIQKSEKQRKIRARDDINSFIAEIKSDLELYKFINYEDYFFQILSKSNNINVPVRIAFLLIKEFTKKTGYKIDIQNKFAKNQNYNNIMIWHLRIMKI